jgi:hypothetical protein
MQLCNIPAYDPSYRQLPLRDLLIARLREMEQTDSVKTNRPIHYTESKLASMTDYQLLVAFELTVTRYGQETADAYYNEGWHDAKVSTNKFPTEKM